MRKTARKHPEGAIKVQQVADVIEDFAPPALAASFDKVGLAVGRLDADVKRVMLALEADETAVKEAAARGAQMLITHHPPTLTASASVSLDSPFGRVVAAAVRLGVHVYCAHTNLDSTRGGTNDILCDLIGLRDVVPIVPEGEDDLLKLVVFVPEDNLRAVSDAICSAGAGVIGEYDCCTWRTLGTGAFRGGDKSSPAIGKRGVREEVAEYRLECVVPRRESRQVAKALVASHIYEEPAYDFYPLLGANPQTGAGRIGVLPTAATRTALAAKLKRLLRAKSLRITKGSKARLKRVAVCAGSGGSLVDQAVALKADVFVTGEVKYHDALHARDAGLAVIECGHYTSEAPVLRALQRLLAGVFPGLKISVFKGRGEPRTVL